MRQEESGKLLGKGRENQQATNQKHFDQTGTGHNQKKSLVQSSVLHNFLVIESFVNGCSHTRVCLIASLHLIGLMFPLSQRPTLKTIQISDNGTRLISSHIFQ